jgi:hypothetical protein
MSQTQVDLILDGSIATTDLADAAVTTAKIADSNITTAKIADNAVTKAKLSSDITFNPPFTTRGFSSPI